MLLQGAYAYLARNGRAVRGHARQPDADRDRLRSELAAELRVAQPSAADLAGASWQAVTLAMTNT